jgi:hypothetical protein
MSIGNRQARHLCWRNIHFVLTVELYAILTGRRERQHNSINNQLLVAHSPYDLGCDDPNTGTNSVIYYVAGSIPPVYNEHVSINLNETIYK